MGLNKTSRLGRFLADAVGSPVGYEVLQTRCEALETEVASVCANIKELQQALDGHMAGLDETTLLESRLRHEHDALTGRLRDVTFDRLDVERKCRDLRAEIDEHQLRMPMISSALKGVRRQVLSECHY